MRSSLFLVSLALFLTVGCADRGAPDAGTPLTSGARDGHGARAGVARAVPTDAAMALCSARVAGLREERDQGGAPAFEAQRLAILGRARGEPLVLVREPRPTSDEALAAITPALLASRRAFDAGRPGDRVVKLRSRHKGDPAALRALLLREGYVYSAEPRDALAMVTSLELTDLFDEPEIWLLRGAERHTLRRTTEGQGRRAVTSYRHTGGALDGRRADLLFGDRVALTAEALDAPLHRDLRALAEEVGFDRARVLHRTPHALLVALRFTPPREAAAGATVASAPQRATAGTPAVIPASTTQTTAAANAPQGTAPQGTTLQATAAGAPLWVEAVLDAEGAALKLGCIAEKAETRAAVAAIQQASAWKRRALAEMRGVVGDLVAEGLRFDRPSGEEGPDRDGQLRPVWMDAYLRGQQSFQVDETSYPVFDSAGKAWPPQVCVDFVLDTYERAAGTWFTGRGERPARVRGKLDFNDTGIPNRRAVLAFGEFAEERPDLFEVRRFQGEERVQFGAREQFFQNLVDHADDVQPGDVVAIHGLKRDDRIHQHAILVEWSDPVTGFPAGLADQMKRPRRRTWEGIMAEAPKRSLYYRVRPLRVLLGRLDPAEPAATSPLAKSQPR
ncbi:hypothetical protein [Chondromyces apiculatus]|uniref:hypothetical protein n=1 Tax=Chondromyces apiculatus TaxID=51 RepID=UPI0005C5AC13|nr:hypothetical protein [Chondromyces apiculatus]